MENCYDFFILGLQEERLCMDAQFFKKLMFVSALTAALTGCSGDDSAPIDPEVKRQFLSSTSLMCGKQSCIPGQILDEDDIVPLIQAGYVLTENQYCLPPGSPSSPAQNCIPERYVDANDLQFLLNNGYVASEEGGEICTPAPANCGGGTDGGTDGGSTTAGGETSGGGSESNNNNGGTTAGGETSGGVTTAGGETSGGGSESNNSNGGTTAGGETSGGVTSGGETSGGVTTAGGETTGGGSESNNSNGGTTAGGETSGGTNASSSNNGGTTAGGETSGGSVTGGNSSGGSTSGGSTSGGSTSGGTSNGGNNGGTNSCEEPPEEECEMNLEDPTNENGFYKCKPHTLPVDRMCSKMRTDDGRYTILHRIELVLQVVKKVKTTSKVCQSKDSKGNCKKEKSVTETKYVVICESKDTQKIKDDVMKRRKIDLSQCDMSGHNKSDLYVTLFSPVVGSDLPISNQAYKDVRFFKKGSAVQGKDELSFIMYGGRENRYAPITERITVIVDNNPPSNSNNCEHRASPLIVHVNPNHDTPKYVELSSIDEGILYDILGANAEPRPYTKRQISWLNSTQYMFLVKPNRRGMVAGVDQMFGDNTKLPDGSFEANGFKALAYYDSNMDGMINSRDSVYDELRLWHDKNYDGVGTPDEMHKLSTMKVKAIDLGYDASFYEQDAHGNETVYKSVIQYHDGSLDLVFDLWFNLKK